MEVTYGSNNCFVALCHFCEHHGPSVLLNTRMLNVEDNSPHSNLRSANINCPACNPFGTDHSGFKTLEQNMNRETVTSNMFLSEKMQNQLQQACFRSLSSEVTPLKEDAILFNDSGIGIHVISHTFFLKDSSARGFQRWFSLIALASNSAGLMRAWDVIVTEMKDLIQELQQMAAEVYQKEEEQCSHRLLRTNFQIANVGAARSLQDITGTPAVLLKLHMKLSRTVLLANYSPRECNMQNIERHSPIEDEAALTLARICQEIGVNFKPFARHVLKGGLTSISTDDLFLKDSCIRAIQYLVPTTTDSSFLIPQHTLLCVSNPYLILSPKNSKITCILNNCEIVNKTSCIVSRLENILLTEDVCPLLMHKQITSLREQLLYAAKKMKALRNVDQRKVLMFFQSLGYDCGDLDILQHWSTHC